MATGVFEVITRLKARFFSNKEAACESLDLNEAASEVIALSPKRTQRKKVLLRTDFAEGLSLVAGDRVQLQQVILNLRLNAAEAMSGVQERPRHPLLSEPKRSRVGTMFASAFRMRHGFGSAGHGQTL